MLSSDLSPTTALKLCLQKGSRPLTGRCFAFATLFGKLLIHMGNEVLSIMILLGGVALGVAAGWFLLKTRASSANAADLATLKERLGGKESELQNLQVALANEIAEHKHS